MSNLLKMMLNGHDPVEFFFRTGLNFTAIILIFAMFLIAKQPGVFDLQTHVSNVESLLGIAVAAFLQTFVGAWLIHLASSGNKRKKYM